MFVRIAFLIFLCVLEPVVGIRHGEAFAYSLFAEGPNPKGSEQAKPQEAEEDLEKASMVEVEEDHSLGLNDFSFAELNEDVSSAWPKWLFGGCNKDEEPKKCCDKELKKLKKALTKVCKKHAKYNTKKCGMEAKLVLEHGHLYPWGLSMVTGSLGTKVPLFWAGFSDEFDTSGLASKKNLSDFVKGVNGLLLHGGGLVEQTEWGQVIQEANDLKSCNSWKQMRPIWTGGSLLMARAMQEAKKDRIVIAVHKELTGNHSIFKSLLYHVELRNIGLEMQHHTDWSPTFEVHEIPEAKSPDCTVAPWLKRQLEVKAEREVIMTCALCPKGLEACDPKKEVTKAEKTWTCIAGDCQNGNGTKTSVDGDRYKGEFKNGHFDGKGKMFFANGERYGGDFKKGHFDGQGKMLFFNGDLYQGDWKNGQKDGKGTYCFSEECFECVFEMDRQVGCESEYW